MSLNMVRNEIIEKFKKIPNHIQVVCVGTTRAHYAIDFSGEDYIGFNMALYKNPLEFHLPILQKYRRKIAKNAIILITLEYPIFCLRDIEKIAKENMQQYAKVICGRNPYCSMIHQIIKKILPQEENPQTDVLQYMKVLEQKERYMNHFKQWEVDRMCKELIDDGWNREIDFPLFVQEGHLSHLSELHSTMERNKKVLINLIRFCKANDWNPILLGLPYSKFVYDFVPDTFKQQCFYKNIQLVCKETGCEFWDYTGEESLQEKNNYLEVQYLNKRGRGEFMKLISQKLDNIVVKAGGEKGK